jgi:peptide/nickel transport system ATP-binding protein
MDGEKGAFLRVEDLWIEYVTREETVHAVNGVSFEVKKGETLGLVGETGAGKTTIARGIMSVLPVPPAELKSGRIILDGQNLPDLPEEEMRNIRGKKITMIFQDPMTSLNPVLTVGWQITEVIRLHLDISKKEARRRGEEMLEMVGINADRYEDYPHQFSGGMKQRVVIAIALACNPELLIADEPTTALDVTIQAQVLDLMHRLNRIKKTTAILITHDLGVVAEMCDEVAIVYAGEIVEKARKEEIFDRPAHPYTRGLFGALPKLEEDAEWLQPVNGMPPDPTNLPKGCKFNPRCPAAREECGKSLPELKEIAPDHLCRCFFVCQGDTPYAGIN